MNRAFGAVVSWGSTNLRRCLRLLLNSAPLALKIVRRALVALAKALVAPYQFAKLYGAHGVTRPTKKFPVFLAS